MALPLPKIGTTSSPNTDFTLWLRLTMRRPGAAGAITVLPIDWASRAGSLPAGTGSPRLRLPASLVPFPADGELDGTAGQLDQVAVNNRTDIVELLAGMAVGLVIVDDAECRRIAGAVGIIDIE